MDIETIRKRIQRGDISLASKLAKCSTMYVFQILNGERHPDTELGQHILRAFTRIIEVREQLYREFGAHV